jgi:hypothetical protein
MAPARAFDILRAIVLIAILLHGFYRTSEILLQVEEGHINMSSSVSLKGGTGANSDTTRTEATVGGAGAGGWFFSPPPPFETGFIPLLELVQTNSSNRTTCRNFTSRVEDLYLPESITHAHRKIPRVVHITSKKRCALDAFVKVVDQWKALGNHTVVFHDEAAMDRLLYKEWPEFPHLSLVMNCLISGAAKADLWRYLVLWEYGGIYSDSDSAPGKLFTQTTIVPDDDSWFVPEKLGVLTQYFMSASPKHPLMYLAVMNTLQRLLSVASIVEQNIPVVTGPGALKSAFSDFMQGDTSPNHPDYHRPPAGLYVGMGNRSVTVKGSRQKTGDYIQRVAVKRYIKRKGYRLAGQVHFGHVVSRMNNVTIQRLNVSCLEHLHHVLFPPSYLMDDKNNNIGVPFQSYFIPKS